MKPSRGCESSDALPLENAASIAALVLTTESLVTDIPEAPAAMAAPPPEY